MTRDMTSVGLPGVRGLQLKALARHHGLPASDYLGRLIDRELEAAGLSLDLPGIQIEMDSDQPDARVMVVFHDKAALQLPIWALDQLAITVMRFASGERVESCADLSPFISVERRGGAVTIVGQGTLNNGLHQSFAPNVAVAFARQLQRAAARARGGA
ncbi:hypothetical protein [Stappia stellulata]|uniref:hypothetical protein n=1 Tax=Stappia stellulata TaxID=71235 RepID=UPI0003F538B5|nr:hypothetical protein [Stappia stellulata]